MMHKEEILELAKKCGAYVDKDSYGREVLCIHIGNLDDYTSAIEEKHKAQNVELQKQIAMLRERDKYYGAPCEYFDDHTKAWIPARFIALAFSKIDREPLVQAEKRMPIFGTWNSIRGLDEKGIKAAYALFEQSLSATQATSDAREAEVKAMAKLEGKIEVLREAYRRWNEHNNLSMTTIMENLLAELRNQAHPSVKLTQIYARQKEICPNCEQTMPEGCGGIFKRDGTACRLNAAQPAQPRKPCTCDGWCDGLCLEKEGKDV